MYGPIVTAETVRQGVVTFLRAWVSSYIAEVSRQAGLTTCLPPFRSYASSATPGVPDDELPVCVVAAPATVGDPQILGDGTVTAQWAVGVGCVASRPTRDAAGAVAALYAAAVRAAVLQHPSLGGFAEAVDWAGEDIEEIAWDDMRVVMAGSNHFVVTVPAVVNIRAGLAVPQPANGAVNPTDGYLYDPVTTGTVSTVVVTPIESLENQ